MINSANATVMVSNIKKSVDFYTRILGLPMGLRHGDNYAEIKAPGVIIGLHPKRDYRKTKPPKQGNFFIGFRVADLDKASKSLAKHGLFFRLQESTMGKLAFFTDPDGTPLYFIQMK